MLRVKYYAAHVLRFGLNYVWITDYTLWPTWVEAHNYARTRELTVLREDANTVTIYRGY